VEVAHDVLVRAEEKGAEVVRLAAGCAGERVLVLAHVAELVDLAVAVARDVDQRRPLVGLSSKR